MCFFVCVKSWEGGLFGTVVLFGAFSSAKQARLSSLASTPPPLVSLPFTRSQNLMTLM